MKKKKAFIIHGAYGNPKENWIPWLKSELEKIDYHVITPQFPIPKEQSLTSWLKIFDKYKNELDENSIVIGHSIGATFILSLLERLSEPVLEVFLASGFISDLGDTKFDTINESFYKKTFKWNKIKKNCFYIFHGDTDPYVPLKKSEELAKKLESNVIVIKNGGHLNKEAGFTTFKELLEQIKRNSA